MEKTRGNLPLTITLGALWGLLEATVGWGMHLLHLPYRSLLLFPIGVAFMMTGVYRTGRSGMALEIAAVAALIKLTNLLTPGFFPLYYVVNPAIAIALEGAAVSLFCRMFVTTSKRGRAYPFGPQWLAASGLLLAVFFLFRGWQEIMSAWTVFNPATGRGFAGTAIGEILLQCILKGGLLVWLACLLKPSVGKESSVSRSPFASRKTCDSHEPFTSASQAPFTASQSSRLQQSIEFPESSQSPKSSASVESFRPLKSSAFLQAATFLQSPIPPSARRSQWIWAVSLFLVAILVNHYTL